MEIAYLPGRAPAPAVHPNPRIKPRPQAAPELTARSGTSGLYAAGCHDSSSTGSAPYRHRGGTLPNYASAGVRYAGLDDRLRFLG